ncbi:MAG: RnfABCDGE type electron transport complex subunit C [Saccharofermentans sp.]|nr:RnfABCDGE type electron transport complex subunit C [Saccharofermentans sp.]
MLERINPTRVILPMKMHYGVPCVPTVKEGDFVKAGQCVGLPDPKSFSCPVHTGVSGRVTAIKEITLPNGIKTPAVFIDNDMKKTRLESLKSRGNIELSDQQTIGVIRDAGICGMGGEGIPTYAKLNRARNYAVTDFLVNCLQSEPFSTCDLTAIVEYPDYVVSGACACARACGAKNVKFLISEGRKTERSALENSIKNASDIFKDLDLRIELFRERFPQGYYRLVAKALYGKELEASDTLEQSCSAVLFNCSTMLACWEALSDNIPMMNRILSVSGNESGGHNMLVPIGTPVSEVLSSSYDANKSESSVIWGNCLTGIKIDDPEETPIIKMTSVISIVRNNEIPTTPCIHCGLCSECCPMGLSPNIVYEMLVQGLTQKAAEEGARDCISCGSCSYICPAGIDLATSIAGFANQGKIIEVNSLLHNGEFIQSDEASLEASKVGQASLLEEFPDKEASEDKKDPDSIVLPFDGGKTV